MRLKIKYLGILSIFALLLSGCLSPAKLTEPNTYTLSRMPTTTPRAATRPLTIMIAPITADPIYDTTGMAYSIAPYQVAYFGINQWAATPAQMLQPLVIKSLQNTHAFHAVVTSPYIGRYQYVLFIRLNRLEQQLIPHQPALLRLNLRVQVIRVANNKVIATRDFSVEEPIYHIGPYGGVLAANRAVARFLIELDQFCLFTIR